MKNSNIIEDLKRREASDRAQARESYRKLVEAVVEGRSPNASEAAEILSNAAHNAEEFARHVELARTVNAQRERVASIRGNGPGLRAQLAEAVEARTVFDAEKHRTHSELERRERSVNERVSSLRRKIDHESRAASELSSLEAEMAKQLGEAVSEPSAVPEPRASFSHTPAPEGAPDHRTHQPILGKDGIRWEPLPGA